MTKCPFCGADKGEGEIHFLHCSDWFPHDVWYKCGTVIEPKLQVGYTCQKNQIAQLSEKMEAWKSLSMVYEKVFQPTQTMKSKGLIGEAIQKLRDLGEL